MNTDPSTPTARRKWLWPVIAVVVLLVWTAYCEVSFAHHFQYFLRAVPAFFLGALVLLILNLLVRLGAGERRNGRRWLVGREARRLCGWTIVFVVSLLALFYSIELWRGKRAWAAVVREAKARGESLDYKTLLVPQPPDEQNFAKAPLFAEFFEPILDYKAETKSPPLRDLEQFPQCQVPYQKGAGGWLEGKRSRLDVLERLWRPYLATARNTTALVLLPPGRPVKLSDDGQFVELSEGIVASIQEAVTEEQVAEALLVVLEKYRPVLDEVRKFSDRPACWFPLDERWLGMETRRPIRAMDGLLTLVSWRASVQLVAKQPEAAFEDVKLCLRLADHGRQAAKPEFHETIRHHAMVRRALQPVWEGLTEHCWTTGQIVEIQRQLERLDLLGDYAGAVRADALTVAAYLEILSPTAKPKPLRRFSGKQQLGINFFGLIHPAGWSLQDQAAIHRFHLQTTSRYLDPTARRIVGKWPGASRSGLFTSSDPFFYVFIVPQAEGMFSEAWKDFPFTQAAVDLATLACALERYRLANGEFPAALEALKPQFIAKLPHDVITGELLKYRRGDGGGFVLYSVGLNKVDDRGNPMVDWVWTCPATDASK